MDNTGIILTLAYPETVVRVSKEWFSPFLRYIGIGKKNYLRAGHAAIVLISKASGALEYYDFGRYIAPESYGRVRGSITDNELCFPLKAEIKAGEILNLNVILKFLATHSELTHGEGRLVASVCMAVNYKKAHNYILKMQARYFIRYAALVKDASNCARFVNDVLIHCVTDIKIKRKLKNLKWFTPSTIGNVLLADSENTPFEVSVTGHVSPFKGSKNRVNRRCFLDRITSYNPSLLGSMLEKPVHGLHERAQWLSGVGAGAWFELLDLGSKTEYRFRRISPNGNVNCDAIYTINDAHFNYESDFKFTRYSNCEFFHVKQKDKTFRFQKKSHS